MPCGARPLRAGEHPPPGVGNRHPLDPDQPLPRAHFSPLRIRSPLGHVAITVTRFEGLPDIPIVGDTVPNYEASQWYGVVAPKNTPIEIVDRLNREINSALADPNMKTRLAELGGTLLPGSPADFGKLIADETEKWAKVVRASGAKED